MAASVIAFPVSAPGAAAATEPSDQPPVPHNVVIATTILVVPVVPGITDANVPGSPYRKRTESFSSSVVNSPLLELCELLTSGDDAPSRYWQDVDVGQCVNDMLGMLPGVGLLFDASNGLLYLGRGKFVDAAWSAVAFIPGLGTMGPVAKYVDRFLEVVRKLPSGAADELIRKVSGNSFWKKHIAPRINPARGLDNGDDIVRHDIDRGFPREIYVRMPGRHFTETLAGGQVVTHTMDQLGRVVSSEWIVTAEKGLGHSRSTHKLRGLMEHSGKAGDEYGHRVMHAEGGHMSPSNFRPQCEAANKAQEGVELALRNLVDKGYHVRMKVNDIFNEGNKTLRPDSHRIEWWVDGKSQRAWEFTNDALAEYTKIPPDIKNQLARLLGYQIPDTIAGLAAMGLPGPVTEQPEKAVDQYSGLDGANSGRTYHTIVGSFRTEGAAIRERDALARQYGRPFNIRLTSNDWWAVTAGRHTTRQAALNICDALDRAVPQDCYAIYEATSVQESDGNYLTVVASLPSKSDAITERDSLRQRYPNHTFDTHLADNGVWAVTAGKHTTESAGLETCHILERAIPYQCFVIRT